MPRAGSWKLSAYPAPGRLCVAGLLRCFAQRSRAQRRRRDLLPVRGDKFKRTLVKYIRAVSGIRRSTRGLAGENHCPAINSLSSHCCSKARVRAGWWFFAAIALCSRLGNVATNCLSIFVLVRPSILACYRVHPNSAVSRLRREAADAREVRELPPGNCSRKGTKNGGFF
jgi:hypothetical protein